MKTPRTEWSGVSLVLDLVGNVKRATPKGVALFGASDVTRTRDLLITRNKSCFYTLFYMVLSHISFVKVLFSADLSFAVCYSFCNLSIF